MPRQIILKISVWEGDIQPPNCDALLLGLNENDLRAARDYLKLLHDAPDWISTDENAWKILNVYKAIVEVLNFKR